MPAGGSEKRDPSKWLQNREDWFSEKMQQQTLTQNKCKVLEVK